MASKKLCQLTYGIHSFCRFWFGTPRWETRRQALQFGKQPKLQDSDTVVEEDPKVLSRQKSTFQITL